MGYQLRMLWMDAVLLEPCWRCFRLLLLIYVHLSQRTGFRSWKTGYIRIIPDAASRVLRVGHVQFPKESVPHAANRNVL